MAKTQEELNQLKDEFETVNKKFAELNDVELEKVNGGLMFNGTGVVFDLGDCFDNEKEHKRYYVVHQFVAESMLTPINVGIFEIDGDNIKKMGYETKSAGQLLVMSYAGRYTPDCKTKLG